VVALVLEDDLPQVRGGLALRPAVEDTDRERGLVTAVRAVSVAAVRSGIRRAGAQSERRDGADGEAREQSLVHSFFLSAPVLWRKRLVGACRSSPRSGRGRHRHRVDGLLARRVVADRAVGGRGAAPGPGEGTAAPRAERGGETVE